MSVTRMFRWRWCIAIAGFWSALPLAAQPAAPAVATDPYYARYNTPGMCEQAARRMHKFYWRDQRPDTVPYTPATERVPPLVLQTARACASRFTVASVAERELLNLAQLYLFGNQDTLAQAAIDRLLAAAASYSATERGWTLLKVVRTFADARPTRRVQAERYMAQLDAMGPVSALWRHFAHKEASHAAWWVGELSTAIRQAHAAIAAGAAGEMAHDDRLDWAWEISHAYTALSEPLSVQESAQAAMAVLDRGMVELTPLRPAGSFDLKLLLGHVNGPRYRYTLIGTQPTPLQPRVWFNAAGPIHDTTAFPRRGEVTLYIPYNHNRGAYDYPMYATLRRLHAKYAARGLRILLETGVQGLFRTQLTPDPLAEVEIIRSYMQDYLKLPNTMGIGGPVAWGSDGRLVNSPVPPPLPNARTYPEILIDKQGRVRLTIGLSPLHEAVYDAVIRTALSEVVP